MKLQLWETGQATSVYKLQQPIVRLGRDPTCEICFDSAKYPKVSGLHAELHRSGEQLTLVHCSRSNHTLLNAEPISKAVRLKVGDRLRLGVTGPELEVLPSEASNQRPQRKTAVGPDAPAATLLGGNVRDFVPTPNIERFEIGQGGIIGRDPKHTQFLLEHPQVSRVHARIAVASGRTTLTDLGSANGTFCNGIRLTKPRHLTPGDALDVGPFTLLFDGQGLASRSRVDNVQLVVSQVGYVVPDTANRKPLTLLDQVEFVLNPGEFLCILGPSGSGKSTLLNIISGRRAATSGKVYVNGRDLHANFAALKQDLSVVPQSATLHETLTVEQSFRFTSELRLPTDLSPEELRSTVASTLETVGLTPRRKVRISQLSGGQLKRAGLGGELLSEPSLLFLDEVTSGLDEHSDGEMMRLFRELADAGKTLVCITHNLAHVEANCHLVAILTVGGKLAFYGSPAEAKAYFRIERLAQIYAELKSKAANQWAEAFRASPFFHQYVAGRKPDVRDSQPASANNLDDRIRTSGRRQFSVLLWRTVSVWRSNPVAVAVLFGQALLVAWLLCMVFGSIDNIDANNPLERLSKIRNLLFLVCVSCFWLGCNNSVKELVQERLIYHRERDYNLLPEAYLLAKLIFLAAIGAVQTLLLAAAALNWFGMPGSFSGMLGVLAASSLAGTSLGLAISASAKNEEVAVALVPIVIIPQIILAGVVATLPTLSDWIASVSVTIYWSQQAIETCLPEADRIPRQSAVSFGWSVSVILLHAACFLLVAWWGVRKPARK